MSLTDRVLHTLRIALHTKNTYKLRRGYVIINTWIISGVAARKCLLKQMDRADRPGRLLQYALGSF